MFSKIWRTFFVIILCWNFVHVKGYLEFLGGGGVVGQDGVEVGGGLGGEEKVVLLEVTTEDLGGGLVGELVDKGELLLLDESGQSIGSLTGEVDATLIELKRNKISKNI